MKLWATGTVALLLAGGVELAQDVAPIGGQFQINTFTTKQEYQAEVAKNDQGDFAVTWPSNGSEGTDTSRWSIHAQRFASPAVHVDGFESGDLSAWSSVVQ